MYHGEVNVVQEDLNSFLEIAEDHRVNGLTKIIHPVQIPSQNLNQNLEANPDLDSKVVETQLHPQTFPPWPSIRSGRNWWRYQGGWGGCTCQGRAHCIHDGSRDDGNVRGRYNGRTMMLDKNNFEQVRTGLWPRRIYRAELKGWRDRTYLQESQCKICLKFYHQTSLLRHKQNQHSEQLPPAYCSYCQVTFKKRIFLKDNQRRKHNLYQWNNPIGRDSLIWSYPLPLVYNHCMKEVP